MDEQVLSLAQGEYLAFPFSYQSGPSIRAIHSKFALFTAQTPSCSGSLALLLHHKFPHSNSAFSDPGTF